MQAGTIPLMIDSRGIRTAGMVQADPASYVEPNSPDSPLEHKVWLFRLMLPLMYLMAALAAAKVMLNGRVRRAFRSVKRIKAEQSRATDHQVIADLKTRRKDAERELNDAMQSVTRSALFDWFAPQCRQIRLGAASWPALNIIYNHPFTVVHGKGIKAWLGSHIDNFWISMRNAQAVRNRRRMVETYLRDVLRQKHQKLGRTIRIISIACGSTQALLEAIHEAFPDGNGYELVLVDVDPAAFPMARVIARKLSLRRNIVTFQGTLSQYLATPEGSLNKFDLVELVGLLDYFPTDKAIQLMNTIRTKVLTSGGVLVTGHICPNWEAFFLYWIIHWRMLYRTPAMLRDMILKAGFASQDVTVEVEPHGIHSIAKCRVPEAD